MSTCSGRCANAASRDVMVTVRATHTAPFLCRHRRAHMLPVGTASGAEPVLARVQVGAHAALPEHEQAGHHPVRHHWPAHRLLLVPARRQGHARCHAGHPGCGPLELSLAHPYDIMQHAMRVQHGRHDSVCNVELASSQGCNLALVYLTALMCTLGNYFFSVSACSCLQTCADGRPN